MCNIRKNMAINFKKHIIPFAFILFLTACSSTKYVPDGEYLLDEIKILTDNKEVRASELSSYVRQKPNNKWFNIFKTQLHIYSLSGRDSTKWINQALRRVGDAPVIYSEEETLRTQEELRKSIHNRGYMGADVDFSTETKDKKLKLTYHVTTGKPYRIRSINYQIPDEKLESYILNDSLNSLLRTGMNFNVDVLDDERQRITRHLSMNGYYKFNKEYITYTADTVRSTYLVDLTMKVAPFKAHIDATGEPHKQYNMNKMNFSTVDDRMQAADMAIR